MINPDLPGFSSKESAPFFLPKKLAKSRPRRFAPTSSATRVCAPQLVDRRPHEAPAPGHLTCGPKADAMAHVAPPLITTQYDRNPTLPPQTQTPMKLAAVLFCSAAVAVRADDDSNGDLSGLGGLGDLLAAYEPYLTCIAAISADLEPAATIVENACGELGLTSWNEVNDTRRMLGTAAPLHRRLDDMTPSILDLGRVDRENKDLFEQFCYEATDCKDAYLDFLRT